ncbi:MAG: PIN domain-containing protein, partial [Bacteroidota bacterium]
IGTGKREILQALKNDFKGFEDSIQYSTALTVEGIEAIITRNVKDFRNSQISVMTPLNYLKMHQN